MPRAHAGVISSICSDHQPHEVDAKLNPFPQTEPGISALDSLLSLVLGLVDDDELTLARAVKLHIEHRVFVNGRKTVILR